jgi:hypothetical protein
VLFLHPHPQQGDADQPFQQPWLHHQLDDPGVVGPPRMIVVMGARAGGPGRTPPPWNRTPAGNAAASQRTIPTVSISLDRRTVAAST